MKLLDTRRWPGPGLLLDRPGAVIDAAVDAEQSDALVAAWRRHVEAVLAAVGWGDETLAVRQFEGGVTLAFTAPIDALYAATDVNEWAYEAAEAELRGRDVPDLEEGAAGLRRRIEREVNPRLLALRDAAEARGVAFLSDDDEASVGLGEGSRTWRVDALPDPDDVDWAEIHDVPVLMVTGTNGKSTTVRLLAKIVEAAGRCPGFSSTDWIRVGDETLDTGDYSGPGGARAVLRDRRVQVGLLETARGGMLRRGLGFDRADGAAILNVAEDHLGEWGMDTLEDLVEAKFILARTVAHGAPLVLNFDDPPVRERGARCEGNVCWFTLDPSQPAFEAHRAGGGFAAYVQDGALWIERDGTARSVIREADIPITFGGTARFNTSNALAACALASCAGMKIAHMAEGLRAFDSSPEANPGRMNRFEIDGATVFADFAHNPHGTRALFEMAQAFEAKRTLVLLGQAGDRTDEDVRALVDVTWAGRPDRIIVKDMPQHLRGREPGAMVALIDSELARAGVPAERVEHADSELDAVKQALDWAQPGDLLLILLHAQRAECLDLLRAHTEAASDAALS